ncbi:RTA1 domain-containing protein [Aspergillus affinis]|uniref:RTA1 domain-containing protein n=1 Tax=Aspergillus affinis TaxID=1070780 RepID=UPI0022FE0CAA|nr:RTA1-domain-containing protein [Aspergillus affinis]KAI9038220.1 RTA1-domain-containing protein [Aspergillus affinis]
MPHLEAREGFKFFQYTPSLGAAVVFIICFLITTTFHTYQMFRTRTWFFIAFVLGGYFEWIGYCARAVSANQSPDWTLGPFIVQSVLPLVAPALFAASIYMELGRLIVVLHAEKHSLIRIKWMTKIFVTGDVLSFLLQAAGAGLMGMKSKMAQNGPNIIIGGLVIQVLFFGFFMISSAVFHVRMHRDPTPYSLSIPLRWTEIIYVLYAASLLILVRSIFRLIEYAQGNDGYLISHEVFLYIFDALLMFATMLVFHVVHPSELNVWLQGKGVYTRGIKVQKFAGSGETFS